MAVSLAVRTAAVLAVCTVGRVAVAEVGGTSCPSAPDPVGAVSPSVEATTVCSGISPVVMAAVRERTTCLLLATLTGPGTARPVGPTVGAGQGTGTGLVAVSTGAASPSAGITDLAGIASTGTPVTTIAPANSCCNSTTGPSPNWAICPVDRLPARVSACRRSASVTAFSPASPSRASRTA